MNKKNYFLILSLLFVLFLGGCTQIGLKNEITSKDTETIEEDVASTIVNDSFIVNIDDKGNATDYGKEESTKENSSLTNENSEIKDNSKKLNYIIYFPDDECMYFKTKEFMAKKYDDIPQNILDALKEYNIMGDNVKLNKISFIGNKCDIDLSAEFLDYIGQMGTTGEYFTMAGIVNSIIDTYSGIEEVKVTVDGLAFETGHSNYDGYLKKYE